MGFWEPFATLPAVERRKAIDQLLAEVSSAAASATATSTDAFNPPSSSHLVQVFKQSCLSLREEEERDYAESQRQEQETRQREERDVDNLRELVGEGPSSDFLLHVLRQQSQQGDSTSTSIDPRVATWLLDNDLVLQEKLWRDIQHNQG